jgi:hypothetical protein
MQQHARFTIVLLLLCGCPTTDNQMGSLGIGNPCNLGIGVQPEQNQAVFNTSANECPTGICLKPSVDPTVPGEVKTGALCTADCSTDADCEGLVRDPTNPSDTTCASGFTCGVAFVKGRLCCRKFCMCKDFTGGPVPDPAACQGELVQTCDMP